MKKLMTRFWQSAHPSDLVAPWRVRLPTDRGPSGDGPSKNRNGSDHSHQSSRRSEAKAFALILAIGCACFVVGCGDSAQQKAYDQAAQAEQHLTAENSAAVIAEYKQVIALQPGTECARKAQTRIEAIEAKAKAEELHKSVFQEHGID